MPGVECKLWSLVELSTNELVVLLDQVRLASLDVVDRAMVWREARRTLERRISLVGDSPRDAECQLIGLMYQGENYLVKMTSDLAFLDDSPAVQHYVDGHSSVDNPFMLPIDDEALEDKCLDAADRVRLEVKCAALVAMKPRPTIHDTFRGSIRPNTTTGLAALEKPDLTALMNRARLIPNLLDFDRSFCTEGTQRARKPPKATAACDSEEEPFFLTSSRKCLVFNPKPKFAPPSQGLPTPGSPRSELPDLKKLRSMLQGRIEPKQYVFLHLVPQLPGKGVIGVPIRNEAFQVVRESRHHLHAQGIAATLIQRFSRGAVCRARGLLLTQSKLGTALVTEVDRKTVLLQACLRGKAVRDRMCRQTVLQGEAKLIENFSAMVNSSVTAFDTTEVSIEESCSSPNAPRPVQVKRNKTLVSVSAFKDTDSYRPELDPHVKREFGASAGFSAQLRRELAAKHIQDAIRDKNTQLQSLEPTMWTTDHALVIFQAHIRSALCRKNTNFDELAGQRCARVDEAIASALRYAIDDSDWDSEHD